MKNSKTILLALIALLVVFGVFRVQNDTQSQFSQSAINAVDMTGKVKVLKEGKLTRYSINIEDCEIEWNVEKIGSTGFKNLNLSLRYSSRNDCKYSFDEQKKFHGQILGTLFETWKPEDIKSITTPSFSQINHDGAWNKTIVETGLEDEILSEYKDNYPKHKSKLHINSIFVSIVNDSSALSDLNQFFSNYGLSIKLLRCEKVFNGNKGKIAMLGVYLSDRFSTMIYDAGQLFFEVSDVSETRK